MKFKHIFIILILLATSLFLLGETGRVSPVMQVMVLLLATALLIHRNNFLSAGILCGMIWSADSALVLIFLVALVTMEKKISSILSFLGVMVLTKLMMLPVSFYLFVPYGETPLTTVMTDVSIFSLPGLILLIVALPGIWFQWKREKETTIKIFVLLAVLILPPAVKYLFTVGYTFLFHLLLVYWVSRSIIESLNLFGKWLKEKKGKPQSSVNILSYGIIAVFTIIVVIWPVYHVLAQRARNPGTRARAVSWLTENVEKGATIVVPSQLKIDMAPLIKDYHVIPMEFHHFQEDSLNMLSALSKDSWLLVPTWKPYGGEPVTIKTIAIWRDARKKTQEKATIVGSPVLPDYYYPLPVKNPAIAIHRLGKADKLITVLQPWHPLRKNPAKTSPALHSLGVRGSFPFNYQKKNGRNVLTVTYEAPGKEGKKVCQLGFTANKKGVKIPLQEGNRIYFAVELEFPEGVKPEDNYLFIQDFNGTWERNKYLAPMLNGPVTCIVSKRIRRGSTRLNLGVMFQPREKNDRLTIKDVKIIIKIRGKQPS